MALERRRQYSFFVRHCLYRRVKAGRQIETWQRRSAAGLHASRDSLYRTAVGRRQERAGVTEIPSGAAARLVSAVRQPSIVGHGRRRKQAHDRQHDWIWIRRGRARPAGRHSRSCPPGRHRMATIATAAGKRRRNRHRESTVVGSNPPLTAKIPIDCRTRPRFGGGLARKLISLWFWMKTGFRKALASELYSMRPTILAWDCAAAGRILRLEANSP